MWIHYVQFPISVLIIVKPLNDNGNKQLITYGAKTVGRTVYFYDPAFSALARSFRNNVVHELGHVFNYVTVVESKRGINPYLDLQTSISEKRLPPRNEVRQGMADGIWQQGHIDPNTNRELFADGWLNWVYSVFTNTSAGTSLSDWFDPNMSRWIQR